MYRCSITESRQSPSRDLEIVRLIGHLNDLRDAFPVHRSRWERTFALKRLRIPIMLAISCSPQPPSPGRQVPDASSALERLAFASVKATAPYCAGLALPIAETSPESVQSELQTLKRLPP